MKPSLRPPSSRIFRADHTTPRLRRIENEYHLELIAENSAQLAAGQAELLGLQARNAEVGLRAAGELARRIDDNTEMLGTGLNAVSASMTRLAETIGEGFENVSDGIDRLQGSVESGLQAVVEELVNNSQQLWQQQKTLNTIVELLRHPYDAQAQDDLRKANRCLREGERRSGRDRDEYWKDAMGLLQEIVGNLRGKQDYVAWFQIGWLQWQHRKDFHAAEEAFYQAQRLSASDQPAFHVKSLRHQAYMQDLQGQPEEAYETIGRARQVSEDHDTLYEAARYAAKTGRQEESLGLLDRCIEMQPTTIVTMFSEEDFQ